MKLSLIELRTCERVVISTPRVVIDVSTFLALVTNVNIYPDVVAQRRTRVADAAMIDIGSIMSDANWARRQLFSDVPAYLASHP